MMALFHRTCYKVTRLLLLAAGVIYLWVRLPPWTKTIAEQNIFLFLNSFSCTFANQKCKLMITSAMSGLEDHYEAAKDFANISQKWNYYWTLKVNAERQPKQLKWSINNISSFFFNGTPPSEMDSFFLSLPTNDLFMCAMCILSICSGTGNKKKKKNIYILKNGEQNKIEYKSLNIHKRESNEDTKEDTKKRRYSIMCVLPPSLSKINRFTSYKHIYI